MIGRIAVVVLLVASALQASEPIDCTLEIVGEADIRFVSYYLIENADDRGRRLRMESPIDHAIDRTVNFLSDWRPVAIEWRTRPAGTSGPFEAAKICGEIPPPDITEPPSSAEPLDECTIELDSPTEIYAVAYFVHENPADPGNRFMFTSPPIITASGPELDLDGYPVAFEIFTRSAPDAEFELAKVCGEIPDPIYPNIFASGFETGTVLDWTASD